MNIIARPMSLLQLDQQVDDLGADRDVERRDRLVADHQLRLQDHRPGDADALVLAAGQLVRVAVDQLGREPGRAASSPPPRPRARRATCRAGRPAAARRSKSPMVTRGSRLASGSWKTICRSLRASRMVSWSAWVMSRPSTVTAPAVAGIRFSTARDRVDLPQPLSPTTPRVSPWRISKLTPSTARSCCAWRRTEPVAHREPDLHVVALDHHRRVRRRRRAAPAARRGRRGRAAGSPPAGRGRRAVCGLAKRPAPSPSST